MTSSPEVENIPGPPEPKMEFIPDDPQIPEHIEKAGVVATPSQFTAQVNDDKGQPLIQTQASSVTITLPGDEESLTALSKGSISDAITWFATFWLRTIKRALLFGWHMNVKPRK